VKLLVRDEVIADVEAIKRHIAAENPDAAQRFGPAVLAAWDLLLEFPKIGRPRTFSTPGVRSWRVPDFKNHLIFYVPKEGAVEILAVLDGRRNLPATLKDRL
jgi:plasmid stabilization system protein ParE